jgi:hypothetical protein
MDDITQNRFEHPKFGANASISVLMSKKMVMEATTIFFFLNHFLRKTKKTSGNTMGRTPSIFLLKSIF